MKKPIIRDEFFLQQSSVAATRADLSVGQDLLDTLVANRAHCVGLAANMIGVQKRIIVINMGFINLLMFNPVIVKKAHPYQTEEGCLSLNGVRPTRRYQDITVTYFDQDWRQQSVDLTGLPAQICQHELDHLEGILI